MKEKYVILIVAGGSPGYLTVTKHINKLLKILTTLHQDLFLLSPYDAAVLDLKESQIYTIPTDENRFKQFVKSQVLELNLLYKIFKNQKIDIVFFVFGQDLQIIPMLFSKIMGKKIILRSDGRPSLVMEKYLEDQSVLKKYLFRCIEYFTYHLADILVSECDYLLKENYQDQLPNCGVANLPVDLNFFYRKNPLEKRSYDLGYFGQLQKKKGVMNLIESVPEIVKGNTDLSIIVGGKGDQREEIIRFIQKNRLEQNVTLCDWIPYEKMPEYLNSVRIFILPSTIEGLSNSILESMACGAIVLSTPVGGAPGVIIDGETGFIMENNTVSCITYHVSRVLNHPHLENIADKAYNLIENEYSWDATLKRYEEIIKKISLLKS
jgi:glycosyltransferase involved in cell wall biosynthesis